MNYLQRTNSGKKPRGIRKCSGKLLPPKKKVRGKIKRREAKIKIHEMSDVDLELIAKIRESILAKNTVPCTGCNYCMPCPKNVDIPGNFYDYNNLDVTGFGGKMKHLGFKSGVTGGMGSGANKCVKCGKCAVHCPQGIDIPSEMAVVRKKLEGGLYRIVTLVIRK